MRKGFYFSCLLLASLVPGTAAVAQTCNTTANFSVWFHESGLPFSTPTCLRPGTRYAIGGSCVQDNNAYLIDVLGNTSPMWLAADCSGSGSVGFTVSTSPLAGPTIHFYMTPSCTGGHSGANPYQAKSFSYRICGR